VENGTTLLETPEGDMPIEVFGAHNLNWLEPNGFAKTWVLMKTISEAIASFKGASKRLEKIAESRTKCTKILPIHQVR
jgi:UDP-N-acetylmuramate: L-alanyl-gamma-D-glutamyl-meso-diaminopimelate ligase